MKPKIYLSCLVVIIGCLVWTWTANAQGDQEFNSERTRLMNIFGAPWVHEITKHRNVPAVMNFLEKYSHRLKLTPDQQSSADEAVRKYKQEEANQVRVEGVPAQGGWFITGCFGERQFERWLNQYFHSIKN